jgi:hypothetical protein
MRDLIRSNDPVLLSFVESLLGEAGIRFHLADANISLMEGSIGIFPRRLVVVEEDYAAACRLLRDAGLGHELFGASSKARDG